ncbi:MAG: GGDEF domain-containing protein [Bacilli bacterium]|nr:GGDEF domain-containing protein [Bacilli bacterium]
MTKDNTMEPEMNLAEYNEYYLLYEMMMQSLKTDDVKGGFNKSLMLLRRFLGSGSVDLYVKNKDGYYLLKDSDSIEDELGFYVSHIINIESNKEFVEEKCFYASNYGSDFEKLDNLVLLYVKVEDKDVILSITNNGKKNLGPMFWDRVRDTLQVILKRAASYERNTKAITMDLLTGLDNRNSYEIRLNNLNKNDDNLVVGIFDLFRLKYVNDNYSHDKGDLYIKAAADILKKYWPKERKTIDRNGVVGSISTGSCVYRVGGDEFVLITDSESLSLASGKANLASTEAGMISLGTEEELPLGLNYGIVKHIPGESIKETLEKADILMQERKASMYEEQNVERRR